MLFMPFGLLNASFSFQAILGLCAVYYKFIPKFQMLAEPLFNLTRNGVKWNWSAECVQACKKIKEALVDACFIRSPMADTPFHVQVDASGSAAGWVVYQLDNAGNQRILGFGGKTFNKAQRNYFPGQLELLAIFLALEDYRWCLHGQEIYVHTDQQAWAWVSSLKSNPPRSVANWLMELMDYNPFIDWIPGKFNKVADCLSRLWKDNDELEALFTEITPKDLVKSIHSDPVWGSHGAVKGTLDKLKVHVEDWNPLRANLSKGLLIR
jgi:hypothetical protein